MSEQEKSLGRIGYEAQPRIRQDNCLHPLTWEQLLSLEQREFEKRAQAVAAHVRAETIDRCANIAKRFKDAIILAHLPPSEGGQNLPQSCEANTYEGVARDIEAEIRALNKERTS